MDISNNFNNTDITQNIYQSNNSNNIEVNIDNSESIDISQVGGDSENTSQEPNIEGVFTLAQENQLPNKEGEAQQFMQGQGETQNILELMQMMQGQGESKGGMESASGEGATSSNESSGTGGI